MSKSLDGRRCPIRCINCGEIMTGEVSTDGTVYPIGVGNDGKCGDGEFEVLSMPDSSPAERQT